MKNKYTLTGIYILGWLYPLSVVIYTIADRYLTIRTPLMSPFDFGNDSIMGYMFYSLLLALVTFLYFFVKTVMKYRVSKEFYFALLNLPLYLGALYTGFEFFNDYIWAVYIVLAVILTTIARTSLALFKAEEKNV